MDIEQIRERRRTGNLRINKSVATYSHRVGDSFVLHVAFYTIQVTNAGPDAAGSVLLSDDLALDSTNVAGVVVIVPDPITLPPGAQVTGTAQPALNLSSLEIELPDLDPGETVTVEFWALAATYRLGNLVPTARLRDTATVVSSALDTNPADNTVTIETVLQP